MNNNFLFKLYIFIGIFACLLMSGCREEKIADVSLGLLTFKDIRLQAFVDPTVTGVTCHVAYIDSPLQFTDPSESSVSCQQTGEITPEMISKIKKGPEGEVVFKKSQSIFFKTLRIRRIFDEKHQTLVYLSYSTKITSGSFKHSVSAVPLWRTKAYNPNLPKNTPTF